MHQIQKIILKNLSTFKIAKYSDIKPNHVESNKFSYHLKTLIKEGFVQHTNRKYSLTTKGKQLADQISIDTFKPRIQPKIVTLSVLTYKDQFLFYTRDKSPFVGYIGFPYGKIHLEERVAESALRELHEKTGLREDLQHRGDVYITAHEETELVSHMLCHVFTGNLNKAQYTKTLKVLPKNCFWTKIEHIPKNKLIPGVIQIAKLLEKTPSKKIFFEEYFLNI